MSVQRLNVFTKQEQLNTFVDVAWKFDAVQKSNAFKLQELLNASLVFGWRSDAKGVMHLKLKGMLSTSPMSHGSLMSAQRLNVFTNQQTIKYIRHLRMEVRCRFKSPMHSKTTNC
jgi:hypothetical protein